MYPKPVDIGYHLISCAWQNGRAQLSHLVAIWEIILFQSQALVGKEKALRLDHKSTLATDDHGARHVAIMAF